MCDEEENMLGKTIISLQYKCHSLEKAPACSITTAKLLHIWTFIMLFAKNKKQKLRMHIISTARVTEMN